MKCPWTSLSVFFPVFNEVVALPELVARSLSVLESMGLSEYELIIVDDGSTDGTGKAADKFAQEYTHVRVIHHNRNLGYGAALVSGLAAAQYDWVSYIDGDGQFDLGDLQGFYEATSRVDVVLGYRRVRKDHAGRRFNAWAWGRLVRSILGLKVIDLDCGFKLFKTSRVKNVDTLQTRGAVISAELLLRLKEEGCKWEEVEVSHYPRLGGDPSGARISVIFRALRELFWLKIHNKKNI